MPEAPLFIISGPSGAGKTSLIKALLKEVRQLQFAVSHTTRKPRADEEDGKDYHFVDSNTFDRMVRGGGFLEHAEVFGNWYGTSLTALETARQKSSGVILEIDWQGAGQVRQKFPDSCSIFILSPSVDMLNTRLTSRGKDSSDIIQLRSRAAKTDITHQDEFDHQVVNGDFDEALLQLREIVESRLPACNPAE